MKNNKSEYVEAAAVLAALIILTSPSNKERPHWFLIGAHWVGYLIAFMVLTFILTKSEDYTIWVSIGYMAISIIPFLAYLAQDVEAVRKERAALIEKAKQSRKKYEDPYAPIIWLRACFVIIPQIILFVANGYKVDVVVSFILLAATIVFYFIKDKIYRFNISNS